MANITTQQLAELMIGVARTQQAIVEAMESLKAGFRSSHFAPALDNAAKSRVTTRPLTLQEFPARVLIGDALVNEDERLQLRINQLHERLEAALKQALRFGVTQKEFAADVDVAAEANLLMSFITGRWQQFAKSGFKREPAELWAKQWRLLMEGVIA